MHGSQLLRPFEVCILQFCLKSRLNLFIADELKEWLEKASENSNELKKLSAVFSFVKQETESKCWQFIETRLSLLLGQYKASDAVSLVARVGRKYKTWDVMRRVTRRGEWYGIWNVVSRVVEVSG